MDTLPVLNVDDHAPARFLRTRILQRAGFGVDEADCAATAIEHASHASLLLLDVNLPDGDGFSVCEAVKKKAPGLPIVMVTSVYRTAQARRDAFAVGADAFLLEPIAPEQLVRTIETLLKRKGEPRRAVSEAWIITDVVGDIHEISDEAATLLNLFHPFAVAAADLFVHGIAVLIVVVTVRAVGSRTLQYSFATPVTVPLDGSN